MSIQDDIDAIDASKPINPPLTSSDPKPTTASIRANFAAGKNALQGLLDSLNVNTGSPSAIILPLSRRWVGKSPLVVASILLPAGDYAAVTALFGGNSTLSVVTLDVTAIDGTVLASVQKTGLPDAVSALPTFTLTSAAQVHFKIYGDFANTVSYIFNIQVA